MEKPAKGILIIVGVIFLCIFGIYGCFTGTYNGMVRAEKTIFTHVLPQLSNL